MHLKKETTIRTICQYCYTGCGLLIHRSADGEISVKGDPDHPANRGQLCPKPFGIPEMLKGKNRLKHPLKKSKNGFEKITWEEALGIAADRLGEIHSKYGPLSLARVAGAPVSYHARDGFRQFTGAFGSPNFASPASLCMMPRMTAFNAVLEKYPDSYAAAKLISERAFVSALRNRDIQETEKYYDMLMANDNDHFRNVVTDFGMEAVPAIEHNLARLYLRDGRIDAAKSMLDSLESNYPQSFVIMRTPLSGRQLVPVQEAIDIMRSRIYSARK